MKKPKIEEQILKQRNLIGATATFLSLGGAALIATQGLSILPLLTASVPLVIDIFTLNELAKKDTNFKTMFHICDPTFKTRMGSWFKKYINQTDDLIEKKYRAIFLQAWVNQKQIPMKELVSSKFNEFGYLFGELREKKLTIYPLYQSTDHTFITDVIDFLNEDKNDPEKIAKAKKIYEEYKEEGIVGKSFIENNQFAAYSFLQDHKLTAKDYEVIEQYNPPPKKRLDIYEDTVKEIIENILDTENNIKHLKILDGYCNKVLTQKTSNSLGFYDIINMQKAITSKIEYLELSGELEFTNDKLVKKNRIKL
jgi:hypothetical protein